MNAKIATEPGFYAGQFRKAGQGYVDGSEPAGTADLDAMSEDQLRAEAAMRGFAVDPTDSRADLIAALSAA